MPRAGEWHLDAIHTADAPNQPQAKAKYNRAELTATAVRVHPDARVFIGTEDDLLVVDNGTAASVCARRPQPRQRDRRDHRLRGLRARRIRCPR